VIPSLVAAALVVAFVALDVLVFVRYMRGPEPPP